MWWPWSLADNWLVILFSFKSAVLKRCLVDIAFLLPSPQERFYCCEEKLFPRNLALPCFLWLPYFPLCEFILWDGCSSCLAEQILSKFLFCLLVKIKYVELNFVHTISYCFCTNPFVSWLRADLHITVVSKKKRTNKNKTSEVVRKCSWWITSFVQAEKGEFCMDESGCEVLCFTLYL